VILMHKCITYSLVYNVTLILVLLVTCPPLDTPDNGTIDCSLGDDGEPNLGDICQFTCDDGFELVGSEIRVCQNDSEWDATEASCTNGLFRYLCIE